MKNLIWLIAITLSTQTLVSQEMNLDNRYKKEVIDKLSELIQDLYIYPEIAKKTNAYLNKEYKDGAFDSCQDNQTFAIALTKAVQNINKDKHMRIMSNEPYKATDNNLKEKAEQRMGQINNYRNYNHGYKALQLLEGNVAYLDLRGFSPLDRAKENADASMKLMSYSDAIIIDLTNNGGGDPSMVQYLCSYFFEKKVHLNTLFYREGNRTEEYWTLEKVEGKKMTDIPLFVMIGEKTFSGAEEFAYNMQTQKRAILIGQTSAGGANPGNTVGINEYLAVFIPTGKAINPVTNTSWEGVGVYPEILTKKEETFDQALSLAQIAADSLRNSKLKNYILLHERLNQHLAAYKQGDSKTHINSSLKNFVDAGLFGEWDINNLGNEYLYKGNRTGIGLIILQANTSLFSESPNAFYSYAEALKKSGDMTNALEGYQKALEIAIKTNNDNIAYYKEALQKIKDEINNED